MSREPIWFYSNPLTSTIYFVRELCLVATLQLDGGKFVFMLSNVDNAEQTHKLLEGCDMVSHETVSKIIANEHTTAFLKKNTEMLVDLFYKLELTQEFAQGLAKDVQKFTPPTNIKPPLVSKPNTQFPTTQGMVQNNNALHNNNIQAQKQKKMTQTQIEALKQASRNSVTHKIVK